MDARPNSVALDCSVFGAYEAIGDAWSWLLLSEVIVDGTSRFDAFQSRLGVARSTLSNRLSSMCANGLIERHGRDYLPTDSGTDMLACLITAMAWGDRWYTNGLDLPTRVAHIGCAEQIHGDLRCKACGQVVNARDVRFDRRPRPLRDFGEPSQRHRAPGLDLLQRHGRSSIGATLQVIGDRWSALVIRELFYGSYRFDEFQQRLGIASNILTQRLRRLVDHGMVNKVEYQVRPTRHEYRLTTKGLDIYPVALSIVAWGDRWVSGGRPPIKFTHRTCGRLLKSTLSCSVCARPLVRKDLAFTNIEAKASGQSSGSNIVVS